jgi:peptidoglycan/LPS O-acetylase OafA/YrhL
MAGDVRGGVRRIPCLDGLRAVSIALVVIAHGSQTFGWEMNAALRVVAKMGNLGVRVFFIISGYLITSLLIREYKSTGSISLSKFYLNRSFRIFPAFYAFVAVMIIASQLNLVTLREGDLLHAVTYTTNYHYDRAWELGHIWSLAVEEQFYLLWPAILLCFGLQGGFVASGAYILIGPLVRVATWHFFPGYREGIGEAFQTVADTISVGCWYAFTKEILHRNWWYLRFQRQGATAVILVSAILAINNLRDHVSIFYPVGETVLNLAIALVIDWCLLNSGGVVGRTLNSRPLVAVGILSYSLYLWQQPFLNKEAAPSVLTSFPANIFLILLSATASYFLVEKPFLRMRDRVVGRVFQRAPAPEPSRNPASAHPIISSASDADA